MAMSQSFSSTYSLKRILALASAMRIIASKLLGTNGTALLLLAASLAIAYACKRAYMVFVCPIKVGTQAFEPTKLSMRASIWTSISYHTHHLETHKTHMQSYD